MTDDKGGIKNANVQNPSRVSILTSYLLKLIKAIQTGRAIDSIDISKLLKTSTKH